MKEDNATIQNDDRGFHVDGFLEYANLSKVRRHCSVPLTAFKTQLRTIVSNKRTEMLPDFSGYTRAGLIPDQPSVDFHDGS
jgi:hypothetical protein